MKYRKKPVVIEATQWFKNGDHPEDKVGEKVREPLSDRDDKIYIRLEGAIVRYFRRPDVPGTRIHSGESGCGYTYHDHGWIDTLEGGHVVCPGDWIITGVKGERYPCKPGIFEVTYDAVIEVPQPVAVTAGGAAFQA